MKHNINVLVWIIYNVYKLMCLKTHVYEKYKNMHKYNIEFV